MTSVSTGTLLNRLPKRFIVTFLGFIGLFNAYAMRMNMSVAIVAMVNSSSPFPENYTLLETECPVQVRRLEEIQYSGSESGHYNWDSIIQNRIIGAFFYVYFITEFTGGSLSERLGCHRICGTGILMSSVFTLLTPVAAKLGVVYLIIVRALAGLGQGMVFPAMVAVVSRWAPKMERSRMSSVIFSGTMIGNVTAYAVSGWLCSTRFLGGWPSAFYVFGSIGVIWYLFWSFFVYESPFKHPTITADELKLFIDHNISEKRLKVPWLCILKSLPFWSMVLTFIGSFFTETVIFSELPTYFSDVLQVDVKTAGFYCALPCITISVGSWLFSYVADKLRERNILSITNIRKIFNSVAGYILALSLISVPFCGCRPWLVTTICLFGMFMYGCKYSGAEVTSVDMSPTYSSIIYGVSYSTSSFVGIIAPAMVGALTSSGNTISNWSTAFFISGGILATTTTIYALFSSCELQPWGKPMYENEPSDKEGIVQEIQN